MEASLEITLGRKKFRQSAEGTRKRVETSLGRKKKKEAELFWGVRKRHDMPASGSSADSRLSHAKQAFIMGKIYLQGLKRKSQEL